MKREKKVFPPFMGAALAVVLFLMGITSCSSPYIQKDFAVNGFIFDLNTEDRSRIAENFTEGTLYTPDTFISGIWSPENREFSVETVLENKTEEQVTLILRNSLGTFTADIVLRDEGSKGLFGKPSWKIYSVTARDFNADF